MNKLLFIALVLSISLFSCGLNRPPVDSAKQALKDDSLIRRYIQNKHIIAIKDSTGLYYQILSPGTGSYPGSGSTVTVIYDGRLLDGSQFDATPVGKPVAFSLDQVIKGWTIGIPKIKPGGKILLIIPSALGYGDNSAGSIPPNAVLTFKVDLLKAK